MKKFGKAAKASADEAITHAMEAIQRGRPIDAERIIREVLAKDPRSLTGQHVLGRALLAQQRPQDAIAPLEAAARQGDPIAETNLGIALDQSGRPADALVWLERAVTRQPPFEHAFYELGSRLVSMRRAKEAEGVVKRGLAINPNSVELSILLGDIFLKRADRDNAKLAFARALASQPNHPGALYGMGTVMMLEGEYARAVQRLQQAVAQDPRYSLRRTPTGRRARSLPSSQTDPQDDHRREDGEDDGDRQDQEDHRDHHQHLLAPTRLHQRATTFLADVLRLCAQHVRQRRAALHRARTVVTCLRPDPSAPFLTPANLASAKTRATPPRRRSDDGLRSTSRQKSGNTSGTSRT